MDGGRHTQRLSSRQCMRITLRSPVASRSISGGEAMAATLVMPGKHAKSLSTSCIASPVYDPAEKPRISISLLPSGTANRRRWGKLALSRRILPWVITPDNLPDSCCPHWVWRSCMGRTNCGCCHEAHCPSKQ